MKRVKYCASTGKSVVIMLPPFIEALVFIHAGGLQGSACTFSDGLIESACCSSGIR